jgi:hypothetical protein
LKLVINPEVDTEEKGILWRISPFMRSIYDALGEAKANYLYREEATKENIFNMLPSADVVIAAGHCYSEDTEILTENGWKRFYELEAGEKVATLNPKTGELEYQVPTNYFKYKYKGKMFLIEGRRINLLVTPNHKLYVSWEGYGSKWLPYRFIEAKDIGKKGYTRDPKINRFISTGTTTGNCLKFKRGAVWNCQALEYFQLPSIELKYAVPHYGKIDFYKRQAMTKKVNIEDWLRFFGVWLAEGSASLGSGSGQYVISIAQKDDEKRKIIKEWVDKVGEQIGFKAWEEATNEHSKAIKFKNKQVYEYLKQFGHAKEKFIPKEIKMLPPHLLRILLEAMVLGDGYVYERTGEVYYSTASKRLADDVQEIAMKIGMSASIFTFYSPHGTLMYNVAITGDEACVSKRSMKWVDYDGYVYSVEVPNHIIYVRRKGKPCFSGNSDYNLYTSYKLEPVFYVGQSIDVDGKKFMFLSCRLGKELIPYMESLGAVGAGWVEDFVLMFNESQDPSQDEVLKLFIQPFVDGALAVASSGNISDAAIVREELKKNASTVSFIDSEIRESLNYNASKFYISGIGVEGTAEGVTIDLSKVLEYAVLAFPLTIIGYGVYKKYFKKQSK